MKASELREKSISELQELNGKKRKELFNLRFKHYTGQLASSAELKSARRQIARIETIIREHQIELAQTAE